MSTAWNVYVQRPQRPMTRGSFLTEVHLFLICRLHHTFKRPISSCIFIGKVEHLFTPYRWRCFHQTRGLEIRDNLVMMRRLERCNRCSCSKDDTHTVHHSKNLSFVVIEMIQSPACWAAQTKRGAEISVRLRVLRCSWRAKNGKKKKDRLGDSLKKNLPQRLAKLAKLRLKLKRFETHPTQATKKKGAKKIRNKNMKRTSPFWWIHVWPFIVSIENFSFCSCETFLVLVIKVRSI